MDVRGHILDEHVPQCPQRVWRLQCNPHSTLRKVNEWRMQASLRIEFCKEVEPKAECVPAGSETRGRMLTPRTHHGYVRHRAHDLHKPLEARERGMREATVREVSAKFQSVIRDLNPRSEALLPLKIMSEHTSYYAHLFPDAVTLWIVPTCREESRRQVMHLMLLHGSIAKNPAISK